MEHAIFVVAHEGKLHGPFLRDEVGHFTSTLPGSFEVHPLMVPRLPDEQPGPMLLQIMAEGDHRAFVDGFKLDTRHALAGIMQTIHFARRDDRVLTARELRDVQSDLFEVAQAFVSLMRCADAVVADPNRANVVALRKAFWRNRDSDDVDPHYKDRFW